MLNISSPCHQYASLPNSIWYSQLAAEVLELDVPSTDSEHRLAMTGDERCEGGWRRLTVTGDEACMDTTGSLDFP